MYENTSLQNMQLPFEVIFLVITKGMILHINDLSITIVIILLDTNEHHQIFVNVIARRLCNEDLHTSFKIEYSNISYQCLLNKR